MGNPLIVMINGSLQGPSEDSNTSFLLRAAKKELVRRGADVKLVEPELVGSAMEDATPHHSIYLLRTSQVLKEVSVADGIIVATGTYWGQGSSTLQRFFEEATPSEGTDVWLGKPAAIIVSEHSSGGQVVLSNLMLTLSNFGCVIPPQGGMVYSRTGQAARKCGEEWAVDVWSLEDISAICHKLISYAAQKKPADLSSWLVERDRGELNRMWIEAVGDDR